MPRKKRAILSGAWWKNFYSSIQHCYQCGGKLTQKYIHIEQTKRHICLSCETITYINPKLIVGVIPVLPDGRILLLKRGIEPGLGLWSYPGGHMEIGESIEEAGVRETKEEMGVDVTIKRMVGLYSYADSAFVTIVYEGLVREDDHPILTHEAMAVDKVWPNKIPWRFLAFRSTVDALRDWKRKQRF